MTVVGRLKHTLWRIRFLATGHAEWLDPETGETEVCREPWKVRWALAGIHARNHQTLRVRLSCGCTQNRVTRNIASTRMDCRYHMGDLWDIMHEGD